MRSRLREAPWFGSTVIGERHRGAGSRAGGQVSRHPMANTVPSSELVPAVCHDEAAEAGSHQLEQPLLKPGTSLDRGIRALETQASAPDGVLLLR
jgi:hypothetical protein